MDIKIVAAHFIFAAFDIIVHSFLKDAKIIKISSCHKQEMICANQNYLYIGLYAMNLHLYNARSICTVILNGYNRVNKKGTKPRSQMTSLVPFHILRLFIFRLSLFRLYVVLLVAGTLSGTVRASATAILSSAPLFTLFIDYTACIKTNSCANQNRC